MLYGHHTGDIYRRGCLSERNATTEFCSVFDIRERRYWQSSGVVRWSSPLQECFLSLKILAARVPLIKFNHTLAGLECDLDMSCLLTSEFQELLNHFDLVILLVCLHLHCLSWRFKTSPLVYINLSSSPLLHTTTSQSDEDGVSDVLPGCITGSRCLCVCAGVGGEGWSVLTSRCSCQHSLSHRSHSERNHSSPLLRQWRRRRRRWLQTCRTWSVCSPLRQERWGVRSERSKRSLLSL